MLWKIMLPNLNNRQSFKSHLVMLFIVGITGVLFYFQDRYAISFNDDDLYKFIVPAQERYYTESLRDPQSVRIPIESLKDVVTSNVNAYLFCNGRFIVHCIVQTLTSFTSMDSFVVLNTFVFCLFLICIIKISNINNSFHLLLAIFFFWFLIYKGTAFWGNIACSVNYLWCSVAYLFFYLLYNKIILMQNKDWKWWKYVFTFFVSVLIGSLSESYSIGISAALFLYYSINRKKLASPLIFLLVGFFIGTLIVSISPGNFLRVGGRVTGLSINLAAIYQMTTMPINIVYLLCVACIWFYNKNRILNHVNNNFFFILSIVFNTIFMLFVAYNGKHQQTSNNIFVYILLLRLMGEFNISFNKKRASGLCMILLIIITYIPILQLRKNLYKEYYSCIDSVLIKGSTIIDEDYQKYCFKVRSNPLINGLFISVLNIEPRSVSMRITRGNDLFFIEKVLPFSPNKINDYCTENNRLYNSVYKCNYNYVVCKLENNYDIKDISLTYKEKYFFSLFSRTNESSMQPYMVIDYRGEYYYLFPPYELGEVTSLSIKGKKV